MVRADIPSTSSPIGAIALRVAVGFGAAILVSGTIVLVTPGPAQARPQFAAQTGLPCGRCHVNPAGGGKLKAFGAAFKANGFKLPKKK
jgi:hypothetical protein